MSLPSFSTCAFEASVSTPEPEARSSTVLKPPYIIETTARTAVTKAAIHAVDRASLRAGLLSFMTARETMMASASATPMTIKGTLIDSTIFHTSDQLMESMLNVLFHFRNPASQIQAIPLPYPTLVSFDEVTTDRRADGNRHHLFNPSVGEGLCARVRSVGSGAQSVVPRRRNAGHGRARVRRLPLAAVRTDARGGFQYRYLPGARSLWLSRMGTRSVFSPDEVAFPLVHATCPLPPRTLTPYCAR